MEAFFVQLPLLQWPYPLMDSNEGLLYFLLILDDYSKPTKEDTAWLKSCSWLWLTISYPQNLGKCAKGNSQTHSGVLAKMWVDSNFSSNFESFDQGHKDLLLDPIISQMASKFSKSWGYFCVEFLPKFVCTADQKEFYKILHLTIV